MSPKYKVTYFNVTGRGEPIRMLLSYGGVDFEDNRIETADWPKVKPTTPLGQLPVLEIDGKPYTQMGAICKYLGSIFNITGKDPIENLTIDIALSILWDLAIAAYDYAYEKEVARKPKLAENVKNLLPRLLGKLEADVKKNGYLALDRLTWVDIVFLATYEDLQNLVEEENPLAAYPHLTELKNKVLKIDNIRKYILSRPPSKMPTRYDLKSDL